MICLFAEKAPPDPSPRETPLAACACSWTTLARHQRSVASAFFPIARLLTILIDCVVQSFLRAIKDFARTVARRRSVDLGCYCSFG